MKISQKIILLILSSFLLFSCGKKSALKFPGKQKKPDFEKVIFENY